MRNMFWLGAALICAIAQADPVPVLGKSTAKTARGAEIEVEVQAPEKAGKIPALIIAPGRGNHKGGSPVLKGLAGEACKSGLAAFSFKWDYNARNEAGKPSDDLSRELEDLQAVIAMAKKDPRVDPKRILVAGKSLGSVVAYAAFREDPDLAGAILLTPLYQDAEQAGWCYPELASEKRPMLLMVGDRDAFCPLDVFYKCLGGCGENMMVSVVGGDHRLNIGPSEDPAFTERNARNISAAIGTVLHWVDLKLSR